MSLQAASGDTVRSLPITLKISPMRTPLLILLLTLFSTSAHAQWQLLGENNDETAYADTATVQNGEHIRMWGLFDLKTPRPFGDLTYLSMKIRREYACHDKKSRVIAMSAHAGKMGTGELIYSNNTAETWADVQPDSAEEVMLNIACGKTPD
jgi:hypothetical protein